MENTSNVNVNFGGPGLVDRDQDGYLGVSTGRNLSMIICRPLFDKRWRRWKRSEKKKPPVTRFQGPDHYLLTWTGKMSASCPQGVRGNAPPVLPR